jgi:predicted RNA-binding protein YlqC (UPF0109 family)
MRKEKEKLDKKLYEIYVKLRQIENVLSHQTEFINSLRERIEAIEEAVKTSNCNDNPAIDPFNSEGLLWTPFHGDPPPLLNSFPLNNDLGRRSFLAALYWAYQKTGIIAATNHIWNCFEEPKSVKANNIGKFLGVKGRSKTAIRHALELFLRETANIEVPDLPDKHHYHNFKDWNEACIHHFQRLERSLNVYLVRYSIALNGGKP